MRGKNLRSGRQGVGLCAALVLLLSLGACSDNMQSGTMVMTDVKSDSGGFLFGDAKNHFDAVDSGAPASDVAADSEAPGDAPAGAGKLVFGMTQDDFGGTCDTLCALQLSQNAQRKLLVKYTIGDQPAPGALVEFVLKDPATTLGQVLSGNVATDETGLAAADVKAGNVVGTFDVIARVPDDPGAGTLEFQLHIASKVKGPLQITLHYAGSKSLAEFGSVKARLVKQDTPGQPACALLDLNDQTVGGQPVSFAWESPPNIKWDKPWALTYSGFPSWVQNNGGTVAFTVVGVAAASTTSNPLAGGCIDTGATVIWDPTSKTISGDSVLVVVKDIPPRLKGVYDLTNYIDLVSVLPDPVENVFKAMLDIVSDPVAGLLSLVCKISNGSLDSLCKNIFTDPKNPSINSLAQPFGGIIVKFLDAILFAFLPDSVKTGLKTGADLAQILTNLRIDGTIEIKAEPDNTGFLSKTYTKENWNSVTYQWTLGVNPPCPPMSKTCGLKTFNIEAFQPDAIVGTFDLWRDAFKSEIKIAKHGLNVKWGALVNYVIQKQLLPLITADPKNPSAPVIDSYGKLIKSLLAGKQCLVKDTCCEDFGKQLAGQQSLISADFLASTCELMITLGTGYLEGQLTSLDVNSGDPTKNSGLLLAADHCPIFEIDGDQYIDSLGAQTSMCEWDMTLTIAGAPQSIKSKFFATRQQ